MADLKGLVGRGSADLNDIEVAFRQTRGLDLVQERCVGVRGFQESDPFALEVGNRSGGAAFRNEEADVAGVRLGNADGLNLAATVDVGLDRADVPDFGQVDLPGIQSGQHVSEDREVLVLDMDAGGLDVACPQGAEIAEVARYADDDRHRVVGVERWFRGLGSRRCCSGRVLTRRTAGGNGGEDGERGDH